MSPRFNRKTSTWSAVNFKKHLISLRCHLDLAIWSPDTGQRIPCFDRCQLIITWMSNTTEVNQGCMSLCQPVIWSMAAIFRDSTVVVASAVVRMRPRAIPLAMITMRKSTHGIPFVSHIWVAYGAPLGGPSGRQSSAIM